MATGTGKTKVLSLALAWEFYHKLYEPDSELARNFLVITPNIIVLDRVYRDFKGLAILFDDPVLPDNGVMGATGDAIFNRLCIRRMKFVSHGPPAIYFSTISTWFISGQDIPPSPDDEHVEPFPGKETHRRYADGFKVDLAPLSGYR